MSERFMIDTAGTLIDKETRNTYDYVSDVCGLLNELNRLAEANEEQGLAIMTYLHDNYYDIWEEVNKELEE